jgi:small-conductance mechanosensitive channel
LKTQLPEDRQSLTRTTKYRLLLSDINFWRRCREISVYSRDNSVGQSYRWITLLVILFHSLLILFFFYLFSVICLFCCFYLFVLLCMSVWVRNSKGRLETSEAFFGSLFDTPTSSATSFIMAEERVVQPEAPKMTMYQLLHPT